MRRRAGHLWVVWALALALAPVPHLSAQNERRASAAAVTAEFLLRFARFTDWPANVLAPDARLVFCTTDPAVAEALVELTSKQTVGAHTLSSRLVQPGGVPAECRVLHADGRDARRLAGLIAALPSEHVLTVGDSETFTRAGGIIHLFIENGRMRFAVNLKAAERAQLRLSSRMLAFAKIVTE